MIRYIATTVVAFITGCASAGQPGTQAAATRFERNIGTGSARDVQELSLKVLRQHLFEIQQQEAAPNIYMETRWRNRAPFEDEEMLGVTAAQTRVIVRAKPRGNTPMGDIYTVDLTIENRVQKSGSSTWDETVVTPQYVKYADRITADLKTELTIGVRKF